MSYALTNAGTPDKIEFITVGATVALDVMESQLDQNISTGAVTTVNKTTSIVAAGTDKVTTDVASGHQAILLGLSGVNVAASPFTVQGKETVNGGTAVKLTAAVNLNVGDKFEFTAETGWRRYDSSMGVYTSVATALTVSTQTSGSAQTYTTPAGCRAIRVQLVGGGGAGGGGANTASDAALGAGGGSGGYTEAIISPPAATYTYTVGAGGAAGATGNNAGGNGADTTFGSLTAKGASGGAGMAAATTAASVSLGGAGGVAGSGGHQNQPGQPGGMGIRTSGTVGMSGTGAASALGGGAIGLIAQGTGNSAVANTGGGGGGGCCLNGGGAVAGGAGGSGIIIIEEMY